MRKLGYALLSTGFVWLLWCSLSIRPLARAIVVRHYEQLAGKESFTSEHVWQNIRTSTFELVDAIPWILPAAGLMLVGGILLDRANRGQRVYDHTAERDAGGNSRRAGHYDRHG
jgi:hypothetical protein